jgi:hypothetical protein
MANEFARNQQDATLNPVAFALPAAASSSTNSTAIDLSTDVFKVGLYEFVVAIPALSTTIAPDTRTVTVLLETSTTSNFAAIVQSQQYIYTGAGGAGIAATESRFRVSSNTAQYARFKVTFGASTTDGSAVSATGTVRF